MGQEICQIVVESLPRVNVSIVPVVDFCRQVSIKPRHACPVKYEVYLTGVGGDVSAQFKNKKNKSFALNTPCFARDRKRKHQPFRAFFVSPVRVKQSHLFHRYLFTSGMPRAACPVKCAAYLTMVREEHHSVVRQRLMLHVIYGGAVTSGRWFVTEREEQKGNQACCRAFLLPIGL